MSPRAAGTEVSLVCRYVGICGRVVLRSSTTSLSRICRRLAHLIASLRQPDPLAGRWRQAYLAHWSGIEVVYLGGGLSAALGQSFVASARVELARLGWHTPELELAPHATFLPLIGAARAHTGTAAAV